MTIRSQIIVRGVVQGVGFRPFVYTQASRRELNGCVLNNSAGVLIDVEGERSQIDLFVRELESNAPPLSSIESIERTENPRLQNYSDFRILESNTHGRKLVPVSADVATCAECLTEMFDIANRRYRYPFINCTNCGPRFTIVERIPYDRQNTTMRVFEMCSDCRSEYENPMDRRFHAEPIACAVCGPSLRLVSREGASVTGDSVTAAIDLLKRGRILAVKGIGGFHLVCDALSNDAVRELRSRKVREDKPFALMARNIAVMKNFCEITSHEVSLLESPASPIVLLTRRHHCEIPNDVAPGLKTLGFMLPYSPLHHLLLEQFEGPLVMTSGNTCDEPICFRDDEAYIRLNSIADNFLVHDRPVHIRTDDSVVRSLNGQQTVLRRSRGFAPAPLRTSFKFTEDILACGAELKSTFCLASGKNAFVSHHIGDLENLETLRSFTEGIQHYQHLFDITPEVVAHDLHPEYLSTKYALSLDRVREKIGIQHHHAHIASCMADNGIDGEVIGVAFDGLGFGRDGKLWGGEFFVADYCEAERVAHLANVPMPGGAKAIKEPWRMAAVYLQEVFGNGFVDLNLPFSRQFDRKRWSTIRSMLVTRVNCPETSSVGRLFDAVSALLTLRTAVNYEGQAAIELENLANEYPGKGYEFVVQGEEIFADKLICEVVEDVFEGLPATEVSGRFHRGVAEMIVNVVESIRQQFRLNRVVLSGGVFQNMWLLRRATEMLDAREFEVFTHRRVPTNDAGISLGQSAIANAKLQRRGVN